MRRNTSKTRKPKTPQRPTTLRFEPHEQIHIGGRNITIHRGLLHRPGREPTAAIQKVIDVELSQTGKPLVRSVYLSDDLPPHDIDIQRHTHQIAQKCTQSRRCSHLARILAAHLDPTKSTFTVYVAYYPNGDLFEYIRKHKLTQPEKLRLLRGAWTGLAQLHRTLHLIHGDITPSNIFVNARGQGVIGDLESAVLLHNRGTRVCQPHYRFWGSACFGAPFAHCDVRRDQVALVLITLQVLSDTDWFDYCWPKLPEDTKVDSDQSVYGFDGTEDGLRITMDGAVYHSYVAHIRVRHPGTDPILNAVLDLVRKLGDIADHRALAADWDYTTVHNRMMQLMAGV